MRKGITPVIAIILLLLITISMVGFAFIWFNRMTRGVAEETGRGINETIRTSGQKVSIDAATTSGIWIRNIGTVSIPVSSISVYEDGALESCTWSGSIAPGAVSACGTTCAAAGNTIRATAPGNYDEITCS